MALIPLPDLNTEIDGNTCCSHNQSARLVYENGTWNFRSTSFFCCVCGGGDVVRDENARTWGAFERALSENYGVIPKECQDVNLTLLKDRGEKLTLGRYTELCEWAKRVKSARNRSVQTTIPEEDSKDLPRRSRASTLWVEVDVRVRSDSRGTSEPFRPDRIADDLRQSSPTQVRLSERDIHRIVEMVSDELIASGQREVSKTEIAAKVGRIVRDGEFRSSSEVDDTLD